MKVPPKQNIDLQKKDSAGHDKTPLLISGDDLAALLQISKRSLRRLLDAGKLPKPIHLGRSVRWRRQEVETWIDHGCPAISDCPETTQHHSENQSADADQPRLF